MNTKSITLFFILIYSKLRLYSNKACAIFILGTIAEKSFRNVRNKYRREKRKWKVTNRSGAGAGEVKRPCILDSLGWLEPYFIERETASNWETNRNEILVQEDDGEEQEKDDDVSVVSVESDKSVTVTSPKIPANSPTSAKKTRISSVTGRPLFTKRDKRKDESEMKADIMVKLKEKLNSKTDENGLYGDLLSTKLRRLSKINKLEAKHEIDNIMFRFQLQQDKESNLPPNHQTQNQCASEFT